MLESPKKPFMPNQHFPSHTDWYESWLFSPTCMADTPMLDNFRIFQQIIIASHLRSAKRSLTCLCIRPLNGPTMTATLPSLSVRGTEKPRKDFPVPVAILTKASLPCSTGNIASSWPQRKFSSSFVGPFVTLSMQHTCQGIPILCNHLHMDRKPYTQSFTHVSNGNLALWWLSSHWAGLAFTILWFWSPLFV